MAEAAKSFKPYRAVQSDAASITRLRDDLARWMQVRGIEQWAPGDLPAAWIELAVSQGWFFVVRTEAQLLATVAIVFEDPLVWGRSAGEAGYVHMLMVDRSVSGRGIGTTLLAWTEQYISGLGRRLVRLDCVRTNERLRRYYEDAGYSLIRYRRFDEVSWASEVALYEKALGP